MTHSRLAKGVRTALFTAAMAAAWASASAPAAAGDPAVADQLFKKAKDLLGQGRVSEACRAFQESFETDPALGALMNLADCLERDGRVASAYGRWGEAVELAGRKNDDRLSFARSRRDALKPKLSFVTIQVAGQGQGLDIYRGNTKVAPGAYGSQLPTDPGETLIQVVRGDSVLWERKVVLKEAEATSVVVDLGEIARVNPPPVKRRVDKSEGGRATGEATESFWGTQRVAGLVVMAVGVAGAAVGFTFGGLAMSERDEVNEQCTAGTDRYCTTDGQDAVDTATQFADASTYTLVASGVIAAVGLTVFVTAPSADAELEERAERPWRVGIAPWFGESSAGLAAHGRF
jgi:hypothetical protein